MAWDWVASAIASAAAATSLLGIAATSRAARKNREHADKLADKNAISSYSLTYAARRADAYVAMLNYMFDMGRKYQKLTGMFSRGEPDAKFPEIDGQEWKALGSLLLAFGSAETLAAYELWNGEMTSFRDAAWKLHGIIASGDGKNVGDAVRELERASSRLAEAQMSAASGINAELKHPPLTSKS